MQYRRKSRTGREGTNAGRQGNAEWDRRYMYAAAASRKNSANITFMRSTDDGRTAAFFD